MVAWRMVSWSLLGLRGIFRLRRYMVTMRRKTNPNPVNAQSACAPEAGREPQARLFPIP
jgi:hypothetical protein